MRYPFNEIQRLHSSIKNASITKFADDLLKTFPALIPDSQCSVARINDTPKTIPHTDIWISDAVLHIAINNLATLALTDTPDAKEAIANGPLKWANDHGSKDDILFIRHLAKWAVTAVSQPNRIIDLIYLAYYDAEVRQHRRLDSGNIILPGGNECTLISQLADTLTKAIGHDFDHFYRLVGYVDYNTIVSNGNIDFVVNETLYLSTPGPLDKTDRYALLIAYILVISSANCQSIRIRHVCMVSLSQGMTLRMDTQALDPMVLTIVKDCLYGPTEQGLVETVLPRKRRIALIMGLAALFDTNNHDAVVREVKRIGMAYSATQADVSLDDKTRDSYQAVVDYFSQSPNKWEEASGIVGIQLINQWLVDLENRDSPDVHVVRLSHELAQDIVSKAVSI